MGNLIFNRDTNMFLSQHSLRLISINQIWWRASAAAAHKKSAQVSYANAEWLMPWCGCTHSCSPCYMPFCEPFSIITYNWKKFIVYSTGWRVAFLWREFNISNPIWIWVIFCVLSIYHWNKKNLPCNLKSYSRNDWHSIQSLFKPLRL